MISEYACDGCGACCRSFSIFASREDAIREPRIAIEARRLRDDLATPDWAYQLFPLPFFDECCFLDGCDRCSIYDSRPDICRRFAAGDVQCQEARAQHGLPPLPSSPFS